MPDDFVDVIFIDPPYNVLTLWEHFHAWDWLFGQFERVIKRNGQFYIFGQQPMLAEVYPSAQKWFRFRFELVWDKVDGLYLTNCQPLRSHELLWSFCLQNAKLADLCCNLNSIQKPGEVSIYNRKSAMKHRKGGMNKGSYSVSRERWMKSIFSCKVNRAKSGKSTRKHPTEKPMKICKKVIGFSCPPGGVVLDCFAGSGSTLVAAKVLGRHYIGCEIEEKFYNMAIKRLSQTVITPENLARWLPR